MHPPLFRRWSIRCALVGAALVSMAASPPSLIHYQGVLRDGVGAPLDGSYAMRFRLFDAQLGGNEILVNQPPPVTVTGGLFNVPLGSGSVSDGTGPGTYVSLSEALRDFEPVFLEIEIAGEVLSPRVRLMSAPYALNADRIDGKDGDELVDTSAAAQTKAGDLGVANLSVGGQVTISGGAPGQGRVLTSDGSGLASWQAPPFSLEQAQLSDLAGRLRSVDPSQLPLAGLRPFDCSTQSATLAFAIGGVPTGDVAGFVGRDAISRPYDYLVALDSGVPLVSDAQIGAVGRLTLTHGGASTTFTGRITEFGLAAFDGATYTYVVRLEPAMARFARKADYRVYQGQTPSDVVQSKLNDAGVSNYLLLISGTYDPPDMSIQYGETDLAFVQRTLEREGIHYHFREGASEELLAIGDTNAAFPPIAGTYAYHGDGIDPGTGEELIATFHERAREFTGTATVGAYRFTASAMPIEQSVTVPGGLGERYEFQAGGLDGAQASVRAQRLSELEQVRRRDHSGSGNVAGLKAGHTFALDDLTAAGFGGSYLVTDVTHFALRDPDPACVGYGNVFTAIPDSLTFRPPRTTPKPVVDGPITGEVAGPAGQPTWVDAYGRIKVRFHWDRIGTGDENSSGWVRVAVPSGRTDDRLFRPAVGSEVVIDFLQGDPDRPVVVGSLYNDQDLPPADDSMVLGGDLSVAGGDVYLGPGTQLTGSSTTTLQTLGDANTDDLLLYAGNSVDDGALRVFGDSTFELRSGSGLFAFYNGATALETARLDSGGTLQIDGDLTVSGSDLALGAGGSLTGTSTQTTLFGGDADTDDLALIAGNTLDDGQIALLGQGSIEIRPGNGFVSLVAADTARSMFISETGATTNDWTLGGTNLNLFLGDSGADTVTVPGSFSVVGSKNFVQNHPYRPDLSVVYTALEGDEAGTYTRGSARLVDGVAHVALGESFAWVTDPEVGLTAHITPRGAPAELWVESVSTSELVVRGAPGGDPEAGFDYIVHGLRIGYADRSVVQPRHVEARVPAPELHERFFVSHPELRRHSPRARFDAVRPADKRTDADLAEAARQLRQAIGTTRWDEDGTGPVNEVPVGIASASEASAGEEADADRVLAGEEEGGAPPIASVEAVARSLRTTDPELASVLPVEAGVELGDLLVIDPERTDRLCKTDRASDPGVVGIVSGRPGLLLGGAPAPDDDAHDGTLSAAVAFSGIVMAKVDAGFGSIHVGDLLTSSPTPGHAKRADDPPAGTVVGKALEPLDHGTGLIRVLVMPR